MNGKEIRTALHKGQKVYSTAGVAPSSYWPRILKRVGIDFVFIDTEHVPIGRETLSWMCHAYAGLGIPPVVRIPSPDPFEASKVLDGGAGGIIAPYIETAEQVRQLIGVARYRPLKGYRLQEALRDPETLEPELREYLAKRNEQTILIINIESVPAIENLDEMLSVPGVDSVLIGPHDLSCNLGIPEQYRHPVFDEAVRTIFRKAREHHVGAGIHFWKGIDQEIAWAKAGGNLIMHSADLHLFEQQLTRELAEIRGALGDERISSGTDKSAEV
ncbi:MAG: HpcH/HpaI aldolase family protein [Planctomycetaceae bacterium]